MMTRVAVKAVVAALAMPMHSAVAAEYVKMENIEDSRHRLRSGALELHPVVRLPIHNASATDIVDRFITRDIPVVFTGLLEASLLPKIRQLTSSVRRTNPRSRESREELGRLVRSRWPFVAEWQWDLESEDEEQWGCKLKFPQCSFSYWPLGRKLDSTEPATGSSFEQRASGVKPHTDSICVPSWSLQLHGRKEWIFSMREHGDATPVGEPVDSKRAHRVIVEPGELLVFYNGWVTHTTEIPPDDSEGCGSLHGVLSFDGLTDTLWGEAAMRRRCGEAGCATLSSDMGDRQGRCIADILRLNPGMELTEGSRRRGGKGGPEVKGSRPARDQREL